MSLTAAEVAEIMRLVEQSGFDELELEIDGTKLKLRRGAGIEGAVHTSVAASGASASLPAAGERDDQAGATSAGPAAAPALPAEGRIGTPAGMDPQLHEVASPLLGTFYRAPKPGAPAFVEVGTQVEADTVIGIIEVMKLMNTVRAGVRGTVTQILAADGALAEYGETLLRVRKAG